MLSQLNKRVWTVSIAGIVTSELDIDFEIHKTLRREPNTCSLTIFNLSEAHRKQIEALNLYDPKRVPGAKTAGASKPAAGVKAGRIPVEISAGYGDSPSLLFRGLLRRGVSTFADGTWTTKIEGEDGGRSMYAARVSESFPSGTPKVAVISSLVAALGLGLGNLAFILPLIGTKTYASGTIIDGQAADELRRVLRAEGISFSAQNGVVQFLINGHGIVGGEVQAYPLTSTTGMVGRPSRDATGEILVTTLLVPNLAPGGYVILTSSGYEGLYRIMGTNDKGSSYGQEWYHVLSLLPA